MVMELSRRGEPGLSGVTVTLKQGATTITSTTTIANGSYSFAGQEAGNYTIEVTTPADFSPTTPLSESVSLVAGGSSQANFGFQQEGSISGLVFLDLNGNGSLDANEIGIAGVQVQLDGSSPVTTVGDGSFIFRGKTPGTYEVSLVSIPSGYSATTLTARTIVLEAGASVSVNFGLQQTGAVTGNIFNDLNGSGAQDPNEPGIAGVTVALLYNSTTLTTNSLATGAYSFNNLATPETYTVTPTLPTGFVFSSPSSVTLNLPSGGSGSASFGLQAQGTVSGTVFNDINGDGAQQTGEGGLTAVTVQLQTTGGSVVETKTTSANGEFLFSSVDPGSYLVVATTPTGFSPTNPTTASVSIGSGGSTSTSFGFQGQGTVSGTIFNDVNGDGSRQAGEPGISGQNNSAYARWGN